ncbi:MAG: GGDEF domain-containing protein [Gammaproteobacteria bacterium]|jgi:GGDEF domain-containing protein
MIELHPELARSIVDELPAGVAVLDLDGRVIWGNAVLGELLQQELIDIIGCTAESLSLPLPQKEHRSSTNHAFRVIERGSLIGISRQVESSYPNSKTLLVIDRENAIDWFFDALATGGFDGSVASRFLSRNALIGRLQLEVSRSRRYANPLSCLVIRIDSACAQSEHENHKVHNLIAATLVELLRWVDVLGQWSARAIVVILPETSERAAVSLAAKVSAALQPELSNIEPNLGVTVGASTWNKGDDAERLVRRADVSARRQNGSTARTRPF